MWTLFLIAEMSRGVAMYSIDHISTQADCLKIATAVKQLSNYNYINTLCIKK